MSGTSEQSPYPDKTLTVKRNEGLDALRGVAILLVLGRHCPIAPTEAGFLSGVAEVWRCFGWTGVDLFFVLSGVLIGGLLISEFQKTNKIDIGRFWIRRFFKIAPSYYALVVYTIIITWRGGSSLGESVRLYMPNLLNYQNYYFTQIIHTWSIAVEDHFYFVLPLIFLFFKKKIVKKMLMFDIFLIIFCLMMRVLTVSRYDGADFNDQAVFGTHLRIDSLFTGVLIATLFHMHRDVLARLTRWRWHFIMLGIIFVSPMLFLDTEKNFFVVTGGITLLILGYACILLATVLPVSSVKKQRYKFNILAMIGFYSYNIYLWHLSLGSQVLKALLKRSVLPQITEIRWVLVMLLYVLISVIIGIVMTFVIERPFLILRDRLFPRRALAIT